MSKIKHMPSGVIVASCVSISLQNMNTYG